MGRLCRDRELTQDLVQACLLVILIRLGSLRSPEAFVSWVQSIARNVCRKELARQGRCRGLTEMLRAGTPDWASPTQPVDPEQIVLRGETIDHLERVLTALPQRYRAVVTLRALRGYSYEEIGDALHVSGELARLWHFRGRRRLQMLCRGDDLLAVGTDQAGARTALVSTEAIR